MTALPPNPDALDWLWVRKMSEGQRFEWVHSPGGLVYSSGVLLDLPLLKAYLWRGDTRFLIHRSLLEMP
jgi:hypothetical protein